MSGNPFHENSDDAFQGEKVRVRTGDSVYEGWLRIRSYHDPAVLLYDAVHDDDHVGEVLLYDIDSIERVDPDITIEQMSLTAIAPAPYSQREFGQDFRQYVRTVREQGHLRSFPLVRPIDEDTFEIVSGHKRVEAARRAGFESLPVRVANLDDWEAATRFIDEHVPMTPAEAEDAVTDPTSGLYDAQEMESLIAALRDVWTDDQLRRHPALEWYLDADTPYPDGSEQTDTDGESAITSDGGDLDND